MKIMIFSKLSNTAYSTISGTQLYVPEDVNVRPSKLAFDQHRGWAEL